MVNILTTDKERIEKIAELLQEEFFDYFLNMHLYNANYNDEQLKIIRNYFIFSEQTFSQFKNDELKKAKNMFDVSFGKLWEYMIVSFFRSQNAEIFVLFPDQKNSSEPEHQIFWHEKLDKLRELINDVNLNYKKLFLTMKEYMEDKNINNTQGILIKNSKVHFGQGDIVGNNKIINNSMAKKWWEKTWIQIVFIISAVFTVITFVWSFF